MPHKSKIPEGPDVICFIYAGRQVWLHRKNQQKFRAKGSKDITRPWRAKIERYKNDIIYIDRKYSREQAIAQVKRFIDLLDSISLKRRRQEANL
jgi:hypothetical protein